MEIRFNNRKELEKYLDYLEGIESKDVNHYYDRDNFKELFLDDVVNSGFTNYVSFGHNSFVSKLVWGIWVEDGEEIFNNIFDYNYDKWEKYIKYFKECFTTDWEEERKEKERLENEYKRKMEELERKYEEDKKVLDKKYNK